MVSEVIYDEAASHPLEESEDQTYEDTEIASPDENSGTSKASVRQVFLLDALVSILIALLFPFSSGLSVWCLLIQPMVHYNG